MRKGINRNLGFCKADRIENIRRIAEVAKLFYNQDFIPIVCAITPYEQARKNILEIIEEKIKNDFEEYNFENDIDFDSFSEKK